MPRPKSLTVRKRTFSHLTGPRWEVDCGLIDGKRIRRFFPSRKLADEHVAAEKVKLRAYGETSVSLTEGERVLFQTERDRLAAAGANITQAVDYFLANHKPLREAITLAELLSKAILEKELAGLRKHSLQQFRCSCLSFIRGREGELADATTRDEIKEWVLGSGFAPKTQRTYLGDVRALFEYARQERYVRANPIAGEAGFIRLAEPTDEEISCLDVEHCIRLLWTALWGTSIERTRAGTGRWSKREVLGGFRPLLGYLIVAMFAGVRPNEIKRTPIAKLDTRGRTLVVMGKSAKTRQRRVIELERIAVMWLRLWQRLCPGGNLTPRNFDRKWKELRAAAKLPAWPHDVLRHTCASFYYAAFANRARLQALLGHSEDEDTLDRHYRAVMTITGKTVSRRMGEAFWALTPRRVRLAQNNSKIIVVPNN